MVRTRFEVFKFRSEREFNDLVEKFEQTEDIELNDTSGQELSTKEGFFVAIEKFNEDGEPLLEELYFCKWLKDLQKESEEKQLQDKKEAEQNGNDFQSKMF